MTSAVDPVRLLDRLDPGAPLAERHLWLIEVLQWVRGTDGDARASVARLQLLLDTAEAHPDWLRRWRAWWCRFTDTVDLAPLLADHGFAPRTAFLSEFGHRMRKKLLPGTPETTDLGALFDLLHGGSLLRAPQRGRQARRAVAEGLRGVAEVA